MTSEATTSLNRIILAAIGAFAGVSLYVTVDLFGDLIWESRPYFFLFVVLVGFFGTMLALLGPFRIGRAAAVALGLSVVASGLLIWASFRFETLDNFREVGAHFATHLLLLTLPLPFAISYYLAERGWRDYQGLFDHAWSIVVRYAAAWLFVGAVWAVTFLSDALLKLVGLEVIEDIILVDWMPFMLTGAAFGLGIAVVNELDDFISPSLVLRLLRLLVPVFALVLLIFIAALPLRGLSELFWGFSAGATLMGISVAAITLITIAVARDDQSASRSPVMRASTQVLSLLIPVIAGVGLYAVWLRIDQYGLTPERVYAAILALLLVAYTLLYALAILRRRDWMDRIRSVNILMALITIALAALLQTPVLNAQKLSTASQLARFKDGRTDAAELGLWEMGREWGLAGQDGIAELETLGDHPQGDVLVARLERLAAANNRFHFLNDERGVEVEHQRKELAELLPLALPGTGVVDRAVPAAVLEGISQQYIIQISTSCARRTPLGQPGCVAIEAEFFEHVEGKEYVIAIATGGGDVIFIGMYKTSDGYMIQPHVQAVGSRAGSMLGHDAIDLMRNGQMSLTPLGINTMRLKDTDIFIQP